METSHGEVDFANLVNGNRLRATDKCFFLMHLQFRALSGEVHCIRPQSGEDRFIVPNEAPLIPALRCLRPTGGLVSDVGFWNNGFRGQMTEVLATGPLAHAHNF